MVAVLVSYILQINCKNGQVFTLQIDIMQQKLIKHKVIVCLHHYNTVYFYDNPSGQSKYKYKKGMFQTMAMKAKQTIIFKSL